MSGIDRVAVWTLRVSWWLLIFVGGEALDAALDGRSSTMVDVVRWSATAGWTVGVATTTIASTVTLTATRLVVPLAIPVAVAVLLGGGASGFGWAFLALAALAAIASASPQVGRAFVQASAYGEEERHPLRPPAAYLLAVALTWLVWAALVVATPLLLGGGRWVLGAITTMGAIAGALLGWPRWHRLSRRWFVIVPIGIVLHDHLVLAETVMLRRHELASLRLAPAGTEAADLTGPASGHAVEIITRSPTTVIFAATPKQPNGRAVHLTGALIAPTRPGRALADAVRRGLPVG